MKKANKIILSFLLIVAFGLVFLVLLPKIDVRHNEEIKEKNQEALLTEVISKYIEDYSIILREDINNNTREDVLVIEKVVNKQDNKESDKFFIKRALLLEKTNEDYRVLLVIDDFIKDENGDLLMNQVKSEYGYALRINNSKDNKYKLGLPLFNIEIIDKDRNSISDELVIFWDFNKDEIKMSNIFY